jgi:hypothetical protein
MSAQNAAFETLAVKNFLCKLHSSVPNAHPNHVGSSTCAFEQRVLVVWSYVVSTISIQNAAHGLVYKRHARTAEWNACVYCTVLRTLALAMPPAALEMPDAGLTPAWRRQKRSSRFERACSYIWKFGWCWHAFCEAFQTPRFESSCRMALRVGLHEARVNCHSQYCATSMTAYYLFRL